MDNENVIRMTNYVGYENITDYFLQAKLPVCSLAIALCDDKWLEWLLENGFTSCEFFSIDPFIQTLNRDPFSELTWDLCCRYLIVTPDIVKLMREKYPHNLKYIKPQIN
jgi:hypothetical protein